MTRWAILTGEYPPQPGGVSDYTRLVAQGLADAGDEVAVYVPPQGLGPDLDYPGVRVRRLPDQFGLHGLVWLDRELSWNRPDRVLIQYVPHSFGMRAMNLAFAVWIASRARRVAPIWVMFHEVAFPFVRRPIRHNLVAILNRLMVRFIAGAAERTLVSIPAWGALLGRICPRAPSSEWLPVPCVVATAANSVEIASVRLQHAPEPTTLLVGHFGTFGRLITDLLDPVVVSLLRTDPRVRILLIGRGSAEHRVQIDAGYPDLKGRVSGTGELLPDDVAAHLRACDLLLQPYPDGVSSRRTSVMAGLANCVPVVTNLGHLSESLWAATDGVTVVPVPNHVALAAAVAVLLALPLEDRLRLAANGAKLYRDKFSVERTISRLRDPVPHSG